MWHKDKLTWNQNYCVIDQVQARCIKVVSGRAHSYNNLIAEWAGYEIHSAKTDAKLLVEQNMYSPGDSKSVKEGGEI